MGLPTPVEAGDLFGFHFPTCNAPHPHPGIVIQTYQGEQRAAVLQKRGVTDEPDLQVCLMLMVSHSKPRTGEYGELIRAEHRIGTFLDTSNEIFACYEIFDLAFVPGDEKNILSAKGPYLGRLSAAALGHYKSQFRAVQAYKKGRSFLPPSGVLRF